MQTPMQRAIQAKRMQRIKDYESQEDEHNSDLAPEQESTEEDQHEMESHHELSGPHDPLLDEENQENPHGNMETDALIGGDPSKDKERHALAATHSQHRHNPNHKEEFDDTEIIKGLFDERHAGKPGLMGRVHSAYKARLSKGKV